MIRFVGLALSLCAAGCAIPQSAVPAAGQVAGWRSVATEHDRERVREWRDAWIEALDRARGAGHGAEIAREGPLLEPDAALPQPLPPLGDYDCRTIKVGGQGQSSLHYVAYPRFRCRISEENGVLTFTKLSGSQRPIGALFDDSDRRYVFLGTLQLGDETRALQYARDRERDMAGLLERIGERRWRLVFPYPHFESLLDVIELTPVS
jgi:hypothetical protein